MHDFAVGWCSQCVHVRSYSRSRHKYQCMQGISLFFSFQLNAGDLVELGQGELLPEGLVVGHVVGALQQVTQLPRAVLQLLFGIAGQGFQFAGPSLRSLPDLVDEVDRRRGHHARLVVQELGVEHSHFQHILRQVEVLHLHLAGSGHGFEKSERSLHDQVEVKTVDDVCLHLDDLVFGEGLGCEMDQVIQFRHLVGLFILGCDVEGCSANQLQVLFAGAPFHEVSVNDHDQGVQGLREHFEFVVQVDQPVQQNPPHFLVDLSLLAHVAPHFVALRLLPQHMLEAILKILANHLRILGLHLLLSHAVADTLKFVRLLRFVLPKR